MMKSLLAANRSEKDSFRIPHSVQQSIPIRRIYTDGIWRLGRSTVKHGGFRTLTTLRPRLMTGAVSSVRMVLFSILCRPMRPRKSRSLTED